MEQIPKNNYSRPDRMRGGPGIWATRYTAGWTVYWRGPNGGGILFEGLSTVKAKQVLETYQLTRVYDN